MKPHNRRRNLRRLCLIFSRILRMLVVATKACSYREIQEESQAPVCAKEESKCCYWN